MTSHGEQQTAPAVWSATSTGAIQEIGYCGVVELTAGPIAAGIANAAEVYSGLSVDSILKGFRARAGLPSPGKALSGWARETTEATFGQWVSGLARLSRVLNDASLASRAVELVDGYAATLPSTAKTGMGIYGWEKLVCGLVDTFSYTGYKPALDLLSKVVRAESFDQTKTPPVPNDFAGAGAAFTPEWYTLPENLYRGFLASGDEALAERAGLWHYDSYWDKFAKRPESGMPWQVPVWLHAYSHVNTFASVAALLEVTREPRYLSILRNAHDWLVETQCYATGGYGPSELTVPSDGTLGKALEWRPDTAEIVCGTWAVFKLCSALLKHSSEARYLEWPERLLYNGLLAALPLRPDGLSPYYADYRLGWATKSYYWEEWPCCSGTYVQAFSHVPNLVYQAVGDDGIAVSLFAPSRLHWEVHGQALTVEQKTKFPEEDQSVIYVHEAPSTEVTIWVRVPTWAQRLQLELNGSPVSEAGQPGHWLAVRRRWARGDRLQIGFASALTAWPVDASHPNRVAMTYGPVALAQDAAWSAPFSAAVPWQMVDWGSLLARETDSLTFRPVAPGTTRMPTGVFRPLYAFGERHPYRLYHDLDAPRII